MNHNNNNINNNDQGNDHDHIVEDDKSYLPPQAHPLQEEETKKESTVLCVGHQEDPEKRRHDLDNNNNNNNNKDLSLLLEEEEEDHHHQAIYGYKQVTMDHSRSHAYRPKQSKQPQPALQHDDDATTTTQRELQSPNNNINNDNNDDNLCHIMIPPPRQGSVETDNNNNNKRKQEDKEMTSHSRHLAPKTTISRNITRRRHVVTAHETPIDVSYHPGSKLLVRSPNALSYVWVWVWVRFLFVCLFGGFLFVLRHCRNSSFFFRVNVSLSCLSHLSSQHVFPFGHTFLFVLWFFFFCRPGIVLRINVKNGVIHKSYLASIGVICFLICITWLLHTMCRI